jgi:uncharacterized protein YjbI with pentapeptide repeats
MSGLNLSGADLRSANFYTTTLRGANLSDVSSFEDSACDNTAWWHAATVSQPLLKYLKQNYGFAKSAQYGDKTSKNDYSANVARLEKL